MLTSTLFIRLLAFYRTKSDFNSSTTSASSPEDIKRTKHLIFYSVPHNARIASTAVAMAIPSVCPSVTRRYCVKTTARSMVQFALSDRKCV